MDLIRTNLTVGLTVFALSGLLAGCGVGTDEPAPQLDRRQGAETIGCAPPNDNCCDPAHYDSCAVRTMSDPSGARVVFKYYSCLTSAASTAPAAFCPVETQFYTIGGGAQTLDSVNAALITNLPSVGLEGGWSAMSTGISSPVTHSLKTYAIGMRVYDSSRRLVDVSNDIHEYPARSGAGNQVSAYASVAAGELLIGGGFWGEAGIFAVDSYAHGMLSGQWQVNGKQFGASAGTISSVAIGLSRCLPSASPLICFGHRDIIQATSADGTSIEGVVASNYHSGSTVVGAGAISSSWSRPIWWAYPVGPDFDPNSNSTYGAGIAFTTAPTGDSGHVTTQIMTLGL